MSTLSTILQHLELALRLQASVPTLEINDAYAHAAAATAAATDEITPELLLGVAYVESRYNPTALSRVVDGVRKTGLYRSKRRPARDPGTSMFCGPLQTYARTWSECLAMRDLTTGYEAATRELEQWLRDRRVRGDITRALAGHACGNHGVNTGKCNRYPQRVLAKARRLRGTASRRAGS